MNLLVDLELLIYAGGGLLAGCFLMWIICRIFYLSMLRKAEVAHLHETSVAQQYLTQEQDALAEKTEQLYQIQHELKYARSSLSEAEQSRVQLKEQLKQIPMLTQALSSSDNKVAQLQLELRQEHGKVMDLAARLESTQREMEEKLKLLQEAKQQMRLEFETVAQKLLEDKSQKFTQQNKTNMGEILTPLKEQLTDFKKKVEDVYDKESKDRVGLLQEILSLKQLNSQMSEDAINLTRALKGDNKAQGNWGEMVLEKLLEASGLQKGREYETQSSFSNEDGQRLRPDVVVHLPENKHVVVDSKVSLTAWERFSSDDDENNVLHLKQHVDSIKQHVKALSAKDYSNLYGINAPDFVLMFIPVEPAFLKALETDSDLFSSAFERNILLVCPSTLLVTLKTIHNIWRFEHQNQNALEIARQAGGLHDQFVLFLASVDDIGDKLSKAQQAYDMARKRLATGKGNLVRKVEQLQVLGAKAKKSMPETWVEETEAVSLPEKAEE